MVLWEWASLLAQSVKNLPAVQEFRVRSLGWEDPVEKEMATHSSILAWKISWTEEPGGLQSMGSQRVRHDWATNTYLLTMRIPYREILPSQQSEGRLLWGSVHWTELWRMSRHQLGQVAENGEGRNDLPGRKEWMWKKHEAWYSSWN